MSTIPKEWEKMYVNWFFNKNRVFFPAPAEQVKWFKENVLEQLATDGQEEESYKIVIKNQDAEISELKLGIEYWKGKYETACILLDRNKPESEQIKEYIEAIERADKLYESHVVIPLQQKVLELEEVIYQLKKNK